MVNAEVNNGKNNEINSIGDSFVRSLLNKEPKKEEPNDETENKPEVQPVRYKGGETAEDVKGNTITRPASGIDKFLGSLQPSYADGEPRPKVDQVPIKAKENEPEYGNEWAEEAASRVWDSGKSLDEVEKDMNKDYPLAAARIKEATDNLYKYEKNKETPPYYKSHSYIADGEGREESIYIDPKDQAEITIANRYGFMLDDTDPLAGLYNPRPSEAARLINSNKKLKKAWQEYNDFNYNNPAESNNRYSEIHQLLTEMGGTKSLKELKKLGFSSQDDYNNIIDYLQKSLKTIQVRQSNYRHPKNDSKVTDTGTQPTSVSTKEDLSKSAETIAAENAEEAKKDQEEEERKKRVAERSQAKNAAPEDNIEAQPDNNNADNNIESAPEEGITEEGTEASTDSNTDTDSDKKDNNDKKDDKKSFSEAMKDNKDAKILEKLKNNSLAKEKYKKWLQDPSLWKAIFSDSGLGWKRRTGLGLTAILAMFSDIAGNAARGLNNNTDFKNEAMDALNKNIAAIQTKRAESAGDLAQSPIDAMAKTDDEVNAILENMEGTVAYNYLSADELRPLVKQAKLDTDGKLLEKAYEDFKDAAEYKYKKFLENDSEGQKYLNANGELNEAGKKIFLVSLETPLLIFQNAVALSPDRIKHLTDKYDLDIKKADRDEKLHNLSFKKDEDYIKVIQALQNENKLLVKDKAEYKNFKSLKDAQDYLKKVRDTYYGLDTSENKKEDKTVTEQELLSNWENSSEKKDLEEKLKESGWTFNAGLSGAGKFNIGLVKAYAEAKVGYEKDEKEAEKLVNEAKDKFVNGQKNRNRDLKESSTISGGNIDKTIELLNRTLDNDEYKNAVDGYKKALEEVNRIIDEKIKANNSTIEYYIEKREKEGLPSIPGLGPISKADTGNKYIDMFHDVPTKNSEWYMHRLNLG